MDFKTKYEAHAWVTFERFRGRLIQNSSYADTLETSQLAASLTQAALTSELVATLAQIRDEMPVAGRGI